MNNPYISVVFTGRNDNYGGDFNKRLSRTVNWLSYFSNKYQLDLELVFVNYNPIEDQPPVWKMIDWAPQTVHFRTKVVTVPAEVHQTQIEPQVRKTVPLFEFIAKNAGIRASSGSFILTTNADILFSESVFEEIANRKFTKGRFYRCDRCDFHPFDSAGVTPEKYEQEIRKKIFKIFFSSGTKNVENLDFTKSYERLSAKNKKRLKRKQKLANISRKINFDILKSIYFRPELYSHCNASGDFLLMHKDHWTELKGFPENTHISTHTDSLMVTTAACSGLEEICLDLPVYHQEHERRFDFSKKNPDMEKMYIRYRKQGEEMLKNGQAITVNGENWGLSNFALQEVII